MFITVAKLCKYYFYLHLVDKNIEVQRLTQVISHKYKVSVLRFEA